MDDAELDRRLRAMDPASTEPRSLDATIDALAAHAARPRRRWLPAAAIVAAVGVVGVAAAATDIDEYVLSRPPFMSLDEGTARTASGLPHVPRTGQDAGEDCHLYVELADANRAQVDRFDAWWGSVDAQRFAAAVDGRMAGVSEAAEDAAIRAQLEQELDQAFGPSRSEATAALDRPDLHGWAVTCLPGLG